ncbi:MAG TPA: DUF433 domain-containing protein [Bryobacteraceae bacterium]|nr:DUF433 domain-containing protein [Bryobacteraceae bacterium]
MRVAGWYKMGKSPEEIATPYGHLNLAQIRAALAYYHADPEEIEADLAEEEAFAETVEREAESDLRDEPHSAVLRQWQPWQNKLVVAPRARHINVLTAVPFTAK